MYLGLNKAVDGTTKAEVNHRVEEEDGLRASRSIWKEGPIYKRKDGYAWWYGSANSVDLDLKCWERMWSDIMEEKYLKVVCGITKADHIWNNNVWEVWEWIWSLYESQSGYVQMVRHIGRMTEHRLKKSIYISKEVGAKEITYLQVMSTTRFCHKGGRVSSTHHTLCFMFNPDVQSCHPWLISNIQKVFKCFSSCSKHIS